MRIVSATKEELSSTTLTSKNSAIKNFYVSNLSSEAIELLELYQQFPEIYARQRLNQIWWERQCYASRAVARRKRVMCKAAHGVGKTHLAGGLCNWSFDCFYPSVTLTTAPTNAQVKDLLWKEVRIQRGNRPGLKPAAPRMETGPNHFAQGYTARDANSFQGRHECYLFIYFDEAVGVQSAFWEGAYGMMTNEESRWFCIFNPTDTASTAFLEETSSENDWFVVTISALDHPNVLAGLQGKPILFPGAVTLGWVLERLKQWASPIRSTDAKATDIEFPKGSNNWYRPSPLLESRVLGRWPSNPTNSIWSDAMWEGCKEQQPIPKDVMPEIGCDVARFGDDFTSLFVRQGPCYLDYETHNGWDGNQVAGLLKQKAGEFASKSNARTLIQGLMLPGEKLPAVQVGIDPKLIPIKIDDNGVGGAVMDKKEGYNFIGINSSETALDPAGYPNRRSEMWFAGAIAAMERQIDVSRLDEDVQNRLRRQLMSPTYKLDALGRRVVEPKADTKRRLGRSPDDADAFNLCIARSNRWTEDRNAMAWLTQYMSGEAAVIPGSNALDIQAEVERLTAELKTRYAGIL
jgi:hypothetical protein